MKICMISYHTCPLASQEGKETGGMNVYVLELAKALARMGHQVDVFTRCQDPTNEMIVPVIHNMRVFHILGGPAAVLSKKEMLKYMDEFEERVHNYIVKEGIVYDVLHAHYYMSGIIAVNLQKHLHQKNHLPLVMTFHTLALMKNLVARADLEVEDMIRIDIERDLVKKADRVITPSQSDASYLEYFYQADPQKLDILPPGVDTKIFKPISKAKARHELQADPQKKLVLFVGRIEPLKGVDMLIYAMKILSLRKPELPLNLWIVGGDISQPVELWSAELQKLEQLRKVLGIPSLVRFVGQQKQDQLPNYYNAADVVVMPSHYESFGMAALEAMSCGVPVITTNVAGISGLLDDQRQELITTVNNPLLLAKQLGHLLTHEQTHSAVSSKLQKIGVALEWAKVAEKALNIYKKASK